MKLRRQLFSGYSTREGESPLDFLVALRSELDNAKLAAVGFLEREITHNFGNLVDGAGESVDVPLPGAAMGDFAFASCSVDVQGMILNAAVTAAGVVTVRLQNETTGAINLASCTLRVGVLPAGLASKIGALYAEGTFDPATDIDDGETETTTITVTGAALGDFAVASFSNDIVDQILLATVTSADTVTVVVQNESGVSNLDLSTGTLRVMVLPQAPVMDAFTYGEKTHNFASLDDGAGETVDVQCDGAQLGDFAVASIGVDSVGFLVSCAVKIPGFVTVRVQNETTGTVNLAETMVRVSTIPSTDFASATFEVETER